MEDALARRWYQQHGKRGYQHEMDVPPELVPEILRRLSLKDRLGMCALVSRAWRGAAVTGTEELVVSFPAAATAGSNSKHTSMRCCWNQRSAGLAAFLVSRHGGALNSLTVTAEQSAGCLRLALPWQCLRNLRSLHVSQLELVTCSNSSCVKDSSASSTAGAGVMVALPAHAGNTALELAQLTSLTSLQLEQCVCRGWHSSLSNQLMALKRLQQLSLRLVAEVPAGHAAIAAAASAAGKQNEDRTSLAAAVSQLTALQRLHLELEAAGVGTWEVVGSLKFLTQLQELELICLETAGDAVCPAGANICWSDLPLMLTSLTLNSATDAGWQLSCSSSSSSASQCHMTALQKLVLVSHQLQPACLASLPQLAHLSITANVLKPKGSTGLQTLLSIIKEQHQLQVLELNCPADVAVPPSEVGLFAALTASGSSLEVLCLSLIDLPDGALEVMFPAGRQLPKLRKLWLGSDGQQQPDSSTCGEDDEPLLLLPLEPWEVQMVLKCCPVLEDLFFQPCSLDCDLFDEHQSQPSCITTWAGVAGQMTGLRSLGVAGPGVDDQFTMQLLMQLTGLQDLRLSRSQNLTNSELEWLTCLTQLTGLAVRWQQHYMLDDAVYQVQIYNDPSFSLKNLAPQGAAPDVWQQLQARCQEVRCLARMDSSSSVLTRGRSW